MTATLINAFIVPADKEEEFLENWKKNNNDNLLEHRLVQWHLSRQWNSLKKLAPLLLV